MCRACFKQRAATAFLLVATLSLVTRGAEAASKSHATEPMAAPYGHVSPPAFSRIVIDREGASTIEGRGSPGSQIVIRRDGDVVAATTVAENGVWTVALAQSLTAGDYRLASAASVSTEVVHGDDVLISLPATLAGPVVVSYDAPSGDRHNATAQVGGRRVHAERLAAAASAQFSEILHASKEGVEVAEAPARDSDDGAITPGGGITFMALVADWLERAAREYQREIIGKLSVPARTVAEADASSMKADGARTGKAPAAPVDADPTKSLIHVWRDRLVGFFGGKTGEQQTGAEGEEDKGTELAQMQPKSKSAAERRSEAAKKMEEYERRIKEGLEKLDEAVEAKSNSAEEGRDAEAAAERRKEEEAIRAREAAQKAEIEKRKEENDKRIAEGLKKLEEIRKAEEAKRLDAERAKAEEERKAIESKRRAEEAGRLEAERAQAEKERKASEAKLAAKEARRAEEAKRLTAEAEDERKAAEAKFAAEEARRRAAEREQEIDEERMAAEAKRAAEEEARKAEESSKLATVFPSRVPTLGRESATKESAQRTQTTAATEESPRLARSPTADAASESLVKERKKKRKGASRRSRRVYASGHIERTRSWRRQRAIRDGARQFCLRHEVWRGGRRKVHVVKRGDTLWVIARRHLKLGRRYDIIYRANRGQIRHPDLIYPGQGLRVPRWKRR